MSAAANEAGSGKLTAEERAALKQRTAEARAHAKLRSAEEKAAFDAASLQTAIDDMTGDDKAIAERIHSIVLTVAPDIYQKTYYGFPAYARNGKVIVFFQPASKFKTRYSTLAFTEDAALDDGTMWGTSWAVTGLGPAEEATIADLVRKALAAG